jgi:hypothetical protein
MKQAHLLQAVGAALMTGLAGLIVGYVMFGRVGGEYVSISTLVSTGGNVFERVVHEIAGIDAMRTRILSCGGIGALLGFTLKMFF